MSYFWNRNLGDARRSYKFPVVLSPSVPLGLGIALIMMAIVYEVLFTVATRKGSVALLCLGR
jgi:hypothetical protein